MKLIPSCNCISPSVLIRIYSDGIIYTSLSRTLSAVIKVQVAPRLFQVPFLNSHSKLIGYLTIMEQFTILCSDALVGLVFQSKDSEAVYQRGGEFRTLPVKLFFG